MGAALSRHRNEEILATLANMRAEMQANRDQMDASLAAIRTDKDASLAAIKTDMDSLRNDFKKLDKKLETCIQISARSTELGFLGLLQQLCREAFEVELAVAPRPQIFHLKKGMTWFIMPQFSNRHS